MPRTLHVITHQPGPLWQQGVAAFSQPGIEQHVAHYRQLQASGRLEAGGPFLDALGGGMMIAREGVDLALLSEFAGEDPTVLSGLLTFQVRTWLVGMESLEASQGGS